MTVGGGYLRETQGETALAGILFFVGLMIAPISIIQFLSSIVDGLRK